MPKRCIAAAWVYSTSNGEGYTRGYSSLHAFPMVTACNGPSDPSQTQTSERRQRKSVHE